MGPQTDSGQPSNLITYLDRVTALVVAPKRSGGTAVSFGSGFFINDRQLVTNRHVIEDANPDRIIVVNKVLGRAISGHVTASTQSSEIGGNDFAVIEITAQGTPITLTNTVERGDSVIAAGFPKFVMQNDVGFQRLMEGNLSAIPPPAVSQGWITATQTSDHGLPVLVHGATISQGNSGGPLTDLCGRVVGVNTYGATDTDNALHLNFALRTAGLRQFLDARHVAYTADDAACHPATMPPATAAANPGGTGAIRPGATAPPPAVQTAPILR
jgi:S1-C subfamily serine protease